MPESRKRRKKPREAKKPVTKNPLKTKWGKTVVVILVFAFLLGTVAATFFLLYEVFTR